MHSCICYVQYNLYRITLNIFLNTAVDLMNCTYKFKHTGRCVRVINTYRVEQKVLKPGHLWSVYTRTDRLAFSA